MSKEMVLTVLLVGLVLIGVCSLVVSNIFYISVINNVTSFGKLHTIGTTKKQIKQIISREGNYLALHFIPFGCIAGGIFSLAAMNLSHNRKKSILTFTSLVLSGMLFIGISSMLTSLEPEQRAKQAFPYKGMW